ncbi:ubiquinone biosynthesis monooxygenase COQ6, mitochondrial [Patella vulgata]|uniref:ubiquinone biosynthesis monooxygenase COQ6, mitochondrial n=1 Tax=Patella vulgata TaxID=6465 RepID=UPI0021805FC3|nr:ubiquinone biosynthesis monooxygenase COQ6, mitochondrial [Patella vulgata]
MAGVKAFFNVTNKYLHFSTHTKSSNIIHRYISSTSSVPRDVDIVISGGGMVGAAMACALAHNEMFEKKKIILLEAAPDRGKYILPENYTNRTCALSPATVRLLESFGAWNEIKEMRYQPVKRMQVWDACSDALITFNNEDLNDDLAYIVENDVILAAIMNRLNAAGDNVEIHYSTSATSYKFPGEIDDEGNKESWLTVNLSNGQSLRTDLLIGADGFRSSIREKSNFHTMNLDYKQMAVVATLHLSESVENTVAWQRFLKTGPIALLPLSANLSSLVWSTTPENAKNLLNIPEDSFVDAVKDAFWNDNDKDPLTGRILESFSSILQNLLPVSAVSKQLPPTVIGVEEKSRAAFPLSLTHSSNYVKPRIALIGDAAHRIHPLAGQGVNLGFGDVSCLNEILTKAVGLGSDPGSLKHLLEYETRRQRHVIPVMATIDGLQRLYTTNFSPLVLIRSLGLHTTNSLHFIKNRIIRQASV